MQAEENPPINLLLVDVTGLNLVTTMLFLCSCVVQCSTHRGVSGGEEDGEGWREINVLVSQCEQHTPSGAAHLSV